MVWLVSHLKATWTLDVVSSMGSIIGRLQLRIRGRPMAPRYRCIPWRSPVPKPADPLTTRASRPSARSYDQFPGFVEYGADTFAVSCGGVRQHQTTPRISPGRSGMCDLPAVSTTATARRHQSLTLPRKVLAATPRRSQPPVRRPRETTGGPEPGRAWRSTESPCRATSSCIRRQIRSAPVQLAGTPPPSGTGPRAPPDGHPRVEPFQMKPERRHARGSRRGDLAEQQVEMRGESVRCGSTGATMT